MTEVRIIAVSLRGGDQLENISYLWTAGGATPAQRVVEDVWFRRCSYYVMSPSGRVAVGTDPSSGPGVLARWLGKPARGSLRSQPVAGRSTDALLTLPKLPSPDRGRRSEQRAQEAEATRA